MVDFNPDKIYRYIPKNLSFDERYQRYNLDNKLLQALQLCDCRGDVTQTDRRVRKTFYEFLQQSGFEVTSRSGVAAGLASSSSPSEQHSSRNTRGVDNRISTDKKRIPVSVKFSSAVDASAISPASTFAGAALAHESSSSSLCALDLASHYTTLKSSTPKSFLQLSKSNGAAVKMEGDGLLSNTLGGTVESNGFLGCDDSGIFSHQSSTDPSISPSLQKASDNFNRVELLLRVKLQTESDATSTDFSEDYTCMTDFGNGSDLDRKTSIGSYSYDPESDSTHDLSVFEDSIDLERVTLNFDDMSVHQNDINCRSEPEEMSLVRDISNNDPKINPAENNTPNVGRVKKSRFQEKELPRIKLLLGQKPDVDVSPDSDSLDSPVLNSTPRTGTLFDTSQEFDFLQERPVKRSTSLKTYKTPPGTPHRKKEVRFADALGLDLEDVRHVMNTDDPPKIPDSAIKDLKVGLEEEHKTEGTKYLCICFSQPGASPIFLQRVIDNKVVLENCAVSGQEMTINGTIRVANVGYHKRVIVRFTANDWKTCTDVFATYVQNSNDGATDRFSFTFGVPGYFQIGDKTQFAIMYETNGQEFWDNNGGRNYIVECYATAVPVRESDNLWMHFL